jgi:hypothetical protein
VQSRLTVHAEEIVEDHHFRFRSNRSNNNNNSFCIPQITVIKWEYSDAGHQLFIDLKKVNDSVKREFLYNILIEFGSP